MGDVDEYVLKAYYGRFFPTLGLYQWLSYGSPDNFSRREISYTEMDDGYLRYLTFDTENEFKRSILFKKPSKINIGSVYATKPVKPTKVKDTSKSSVPNVPVFKEIVFDIDLTDYDDTRTCCKGADVCQKCWVFMVIASKILDAALREDFQFSNILFVFSGRRGIHCWVCDPIARTLGHIPRSALALYMQISNNPYARIFSLKSITPSVERALSIIDKYFVPSIIIEQDVLGTDERLNKFLNLIDPGVRPFFADEVSKVTSSLERWTAFQGVFNELLQKGKLPRQLKNLREEIKFHFAYPRLDIKVTTDLTHLLKAPFCVHPETGKVCIPFNVRTVDRFDPNKVPTVWQLMNEVDIYDRKTKAIWMDIEPPKIPDIKKTSLYDPTMLFKGFLKDLEKTKEKKKTEVGDLPF